jgi:hypothetical protein
MIDFILGYLRDLLNQHLKIEFSFPDNKVVLSNLVENDGSHTEDKIVVFLLQIEEESSLKNPGIKWSMSNSNFSNIGSPMYLNLHVFFCMNFQKKNYFEGLKYLSWVVNFFQTNKTIKLPSSAGFSNDFDKDTVELCKTSYDQLSNIWSAIGAKLMPSALYQIRLVNMKDTRVIGVIPAISQAESNEEH